MEQGREKTHTTRRTLYMPALIASAVLVACAVALLAVSQKAEAAFPGKNGRMAYTSTSNGVIYSLEPGGGTKTEVAEGYQPSFSPDGNRIAHTVFGGASAREASSGTSEGFKPSGGAGPAYKASEKLQITKTEAGARVTLNWVYAEENYVSIGYQVENLKDDRRVAGHPAELQPILGFGYGEPTPREEEYLKKYGLGDEIVALTDERGTKFRMVDNLADLRGIQAGGRAPGKPGGLQAQRGTQAGQGPRLPPADTPLRERGRPVRREVAAAGALPGRSLRVQVRRPRASRPRGRRRQEGDGRGRHAEAGPGDRLPWEAPGGRLLPPPDDEHLWTSTAARARSSTAGARAAGPRPARRGATPPRGATSSC